MASPPTRLRALTVLLLALTLAMPLLPAPAQAAHPGANGVIAFTRADDIWLVNQDGSGLRNLTSTPDLREDHAQVSPDGRRVAFESSEVGIDPWIDVIDTDGANRTTLVAVGGTLSGAYQPTWSPDGGFIAVAAREVGSGLDELWVFRADGSAQGIKLLAGELAESPSWSVTDQIAFTRAGDLWAVDATTGQQRLLNDGAPHNFRNPDWAPDASRIVFNCEITDMVCAVDPDGGNLRELTARSLSNGGTAPTRYMTNPHHSPDGTQLVFHGNDVATGDGTFLIHRSPEAGVGPDNTDAQPVTSGSPEDLHPHWGPASGNGSPIPPPTEPPVEPGQPLPPGGFDGDPATTERVGDGEPLLAAISVSRARFNAQTGRAVSYVVLSRDDAFADSLAGSALTGFGPMLFTPSSALDQTTSAEIDRVLSPGGIIYLLGGTSALSAGVEESLRAAGYQPVRLSGPSRVETAIAVADEVRRLFAAGDSGTVLLARAGAPADNPTAAWADSVAAGGLAAYAAVPVLLTDTASLHPAVAQWLQADGTTQTVLLGGTAALSTAVEGSVPGPQRVAGAERTETAAAIATRLWPDEEGRAFVIVPGGDVRGWAYGLAAAGLSADAEAPVLLVTSQVTPATAGLVATCGAPAVDLVLMGDEAAVSSATEAELDRLDGQAC